MDSFFRKKNNNKETYKYQSTVPQLCVFRTPTVYVCVTFSIIKKHQTLAKLTIIIQIILSADVTALRVLFRPLVVQKTLLAKQRSSSQHTFSNRKLLLLK